MTGNVERGVLARREQSESELTHHAENVLY